MLTESIRSVYRTNLGVKKNERVLVFTDRVQGKEVVDAAEECRRARLRDVAFLVAETGKAFAKKLLYGEYPSTMSHGAEPPEELWHQAFGEKALKELIDAGTLPLLLAKKATDEDIAKAEVVVRRNSCFAVNAVIALSNFSTSHTRFRDLITRVCGARYASMPLFDVSMFEGPMNVDWKELAGRTARIAGLVNKAEGIEIKTPNGTHIKLSKKGRKAMSDTGILTKKGAFGNLPAGEVYLAPLEGTSKGRLVLEWAPARRLTSPVTLTVENGCVVDVSGDEPYTKILKTRLKERKENSNIAELGIGTNSRARRPDNILESEKILGTIHIALGDNSSFGGSVRTPFHQDFVFFGPTVTLISQDGEKTVLMKRGEFALK